MIAAPSPHSRPQEQRLGTGTAGLGTTSGARSCPSLRPYLQIFFSSFILPGSSCGSPEVVSSSTSSARRWSISAGTEAPELPGQPPRRSLKPGDPRPGTSRAAGPSRDWAAPSSGPNRAPPHKPRLLSRPRPHGEPRPPCTPLGDTPTNSPAHRVLRSRPSLRTAPPV